MIIPGLIDNQPLAGYDPDAVYAAAAAVRAYCGWHIAPSIEETITVDGSGTTLLLLPTLRLTAVTSLVYNGVELDPATYSWSEHGIVETIWYSSRPRIAQLTITHGYAGCPLEVRAVVARLAKDGLTPARVKSSTEGPYSVTYADASQGAVDSYSAAVLDRYRIPSRP